MVLYSSGGAVTVTRTGRLTGVDGVALRSESGNLSLTVADKGMVTGDVQARGGGRPLPGSLAAIREAFAEDRPHAIVTAKYGLL